MVSHLRRKDIISDLRQKGKRRKGQEDNPLYRDQNCSEQCPTHQSSPPPQSTLLPLGLEDLETQGIVLNSNIFSFCILFSSTLQLWGFPDWYTTSNSAVCGYFLGLAHQRGCCNSLLADLHPPYTVPQAGHTSTENCFCVCSISNSSDHPKPCWAPWTTESCLLIFKWFLISSLQAMSPNSLATWRRVFIFLQKRHSSQEAMPFFYLFLILKNIGDSGAHL